ncbi:MAG: tetratricopeptide repeat protein [Deltaproteobacteria bacterium]|nr:tetratricopeptide repeat protein [Deltaproteobacteria bacterium]
MRRPLRQWLATAVAFAALAGARPASAEGALEGTWDTPYGRIRLERAGTEYVGKLLESGRACGYGRGTEVVHGQLLDGVFTGEMRVCYARQCHPDEWLLLLGMPFRNERLVGSLMLPERGCPNGVTAGPVTLTRAKMGDLATPLPRPTPKVEMHPQAKPLYDEGVAKLSRGDGSGAQKRFKLALEYDPKNPIIHESLGVAFRLRKDYTNARASYQAAIKLGRLPSSYYNLACIFALEGKPREAMATLSTALKMGFADPDIGKDQDLKSLLDLPGFEELRRQAAERNRLRAGP